MPTSLEARGVGQGERARMVQELAGQVGATAVVVRDRKQKLLSTVDPSAVVHCRSIRKILLGAPSGHAVSAGTIARTRRLPS